MHESYVTRYEPPAFFQDTMGRGRFKRYQHDHYFYEMNDRTVLNDKIRFTMPLGFLGHIVGKFVLVPYLSKRLRRRLALLKRVAENRKEWQKYLPEVQNIIKHAGGTSRLPTHHQQLFTDGAQ